MLQEGRDFFASEDIPDFHGSIPASRSETPAVRAEGNGPDVMAVSAKSEKSLRVFLLARPRMPIPDPHGVVVARGDKTAPIRAECDAADDAGMAVNGEHFLPRWDVPDLHGSIPARGDQTPAVVAE